MMWRPAFLFFKQMWSLLTFYVTSQQMYVVRLAWAMTRKNNDKNVSLLSSKSFEKKQHILTRRLFERQHVVALKHWWFFVNEIHSIHRNYRLQSEGKACNRCAWPFCRRFENMHHSPVIRTFQLHEFPISSLWIHKINFVNLRFQLH
jgi:hypothetical protein